LPIERTAVALATRDRGSECNTSAEDRCRRSALHAGTGLAVDYRVQRRSFMRRLAVLAGFAPLLLRVGWALLRLPRSGKRGRERARGAINAVFAHAESSGLVRPLEDFDGDFSDYPELRALDLAYPAIRRECLAVLAQRARLPDVRRLGGVYTDTAMHRIGWKALLLKSCSAAVPHNGALCPETHALLARIPCAYNAFLSVLEPGQHIAAHFGYYKGLLRYHLGVEIPNDNADRRCWIRINFDPHDHARRDRRLIVNGRKRYWHNGRAFMFDDTYLHDACNGSDAVRVVLFVDVVRKLPAPLAWFNALCLWAAYRVEPALRGMARAGAVPTSLENA
jgi:beta-hydroxylase